MTKKWLKSVTAAALACVMCLSGAAGVSADSTSYGVRVDGWNGFSGDGTTEKSPDGTAGEVVKLTGGTTTLDLGTHTNDTLVTARVWAESAQNASITVKSSADVTVGMLGLKSDGSVEGGTSDTYTAGEWLDVKILVFANGGIYRTYVGDSFIAQGAFTSAARDVKTISFSAEGTIYISSIAAHSYTSGLINEDLTDSYAANFTGSAGDSAIGMDGWVSEWNNDNVGVSYTVENDPIDRANDKFVVKAMSDASEPNGKVERFAYSTNITRDTIFESKIYIPEKLDDGSTENDQYIMKLTLRTDLDAKEAVYIQMNTRVNQNFITRTGGDSASANGGALLKSGEWNLVQLVMSIDRQSADIYLNGEKINQLPCSLMKGNDKAAKISSVMFDMWRKTKGVIYIKDIKLRERAAVKSPAAEGAKTTIYSQNFDGLTAGTEIGDFVHFKHGMDTQKTMTLTVQEDKAGRSGKVGQLFDPNYSDSEAVSVKRYTDDGEVDTASAAESKDAKKEESLSRDISSYSSVISKNGNITLKFKYYNAKNVVNANNNDAPIDILIIGLSKSSRLVDNETVKNYLHFQNTDLNFYKNSTSSVRYRPDAQVKKWTDVTMSIVKNSDNTATATVTSLPAGSVTPLTHTESLDSFNAETYKYFVMQLNQLYGGKYYLDDIEIYTAAAGTPQVDYTEDELMSLEHAVLTPVYSNDITRNNVSVVTVDGIAFKDADGNAMTGALDDSYIVDTVSYTQWKPFPQGAKSAQLFVAAFDSKGMLKSTAARTLSDKIGSAKLADINLSCSGAEYIRCFVFTDAMYPLSAPFFIGKNVTVWIAGDSIATIYGKNDYPQTGWGMVLADEFEDGSITVGNKATGGRSSKSFILEGRFDEILSSAKEGDYLLVSFGHNDRSHTASTGSTTIRYTDPTLGADIEDPNPSADTEKSSYKWYMKQYIDGARKKGVTPIFITSIPVLTTDSNGNIKDSEPPISPYASAMKELAASESVCVIDLREELTKYLNTLDEKGKQSLYMVFDTADYASDPLFDLDKFVNDYKIENKYYNETTKTYSDTTHLRLEGAKKCAEIIAKAIKLLPIGLSGYVK